MPKPKEFDTNKNLINSSNWKSFQNRVRVHYKREEFIDDDLDLNLYNNESEYEKHREIAIATKPAGNSPEGQSEGGQRHQNEAIAITTMIMLENEISSQIKLVYKKSVERDKEIVDIGVGLGYKKEKLLMAIKNYTLCSTHAISRKTRRRITGRYLNHNESYYERVDIVPDEIDWDYYLDEDIRIIDVKNQIQVGHIDCKNSPKGINATSQAHHCRTLIKEQELIGNKDYVPWLLNNDYDNEAGKKANNNYGQWVDANSPKGFRTVLEVYKHNILPVYVTRYTDENIIIPKYKNFPVRVFHQYETDFTNWCNHITK